MPTSINNLGNTPSSVSCSNLNAGYEYDQHYTYILHPSIRVNSASTTWTPPYPTNNNPTNAVYVNNGNDWAVVERCHVVENGQWKRSAPILWERYFQNQVKIKPCGLDYLPEFNGISYMQHSIRDGYYIPQGWTLQGFSWAGKYDEVLDGLFLTQSTALAQLVNPGQRKALILARRASTVYVGRSSYVGARGISPPGPRPNVFTWVQPNWAIRNLPQTFNGNIIGVAVYSQNANSVACGGQGPSEHIAQLPTNYAMPFAVDQIVSARYTAEDCTPDCFDFRHCNHSCCSNIFFHFRSNVTQLSNLPDTPP